MSLLYVHEFMFQIGILVRVFHACLIWKFFKFHYVVNYQLFENLIVSWIEPLLSFVIMKRREVTIFFSIATLVAWCGVMSLLGASVIISSEVRKATLVESPLNGKRSPSKTFYSRLGWLASFITFEGNIITVPYLKRLLLKKLWLLESKWGEEQSFRYNKGLPFFQELLTCHQVATPSVPIQGEKMNSSLLTLVVQLLLSWLVGVVFVVCCTLAWLLVSLFFFCLLST